MLNKTDLQRDRQRSPPASPDVGAPTPDVVPDEGGPLPDVVPDVGGAPRLMWCLNVARGGGYPKSALYFS